MYGQVGRFASATISTVLDAALKYDMLAYLVMVALRLLVLSLPALSELMEDVEAQAF